MAMNPSHSTQQAGASDQVGARLLGGLATKEAALPPQGWAMRGAGAARAETSGDPGAPPSFAIAVIVAGAMGLAATTLMYFAL